MALSALSGAWAAKLSTERLKARRCPAIMTLRLSRQFILRHYEHFCGHCSVVYTSFLQPALEGLFLCLQFFRQGQASQHIHQLQQKRIALLTYPSCTYLGNHCLFIISGDIMGFCLQIMYTASLFLKALVLSYYIHYFPCTTTHRCRKSTVTTDQCKTPYNQYPSYTTPLVHSYDDRSANCCSLPLFIRNDVPASSIWTGC